MRKLTPAQLQAILRGETPTYSTKPKRKRSAMEPDKVAMAMVKGGLRDDVF